MRASVKEGIAETMSQFSMSCLISQFWKNQGRPKVMSHWVTRTLKEGLSDTGYETAD